MLRIGIVGLSLVGKTTLFRILTHAQTGKVPGGKPEAHVGVVKVPDPRLDRLAEMFHPQKVIHASIEYVDTPASVIQLARTGTQAAALKEMNALAHVVRVFEDSTIPVEGDAVDPKRDTESVELELILSDLAIVEKRLERLDKDLKKQKSPALEKEHLALGKAKEALEGQKPLRELALSPEEELALRGFTFLSLKPMLYVLNLGERDAARTDAAEEFALDTGLKQRPKTAVTAVCGKIEEELSELSDAESAEFLASYSLKESAISRLIRSSYRLLGLISFFTVGEDECRAWTIREGTTALEAAGEIHSDIQRGFIRAEVIPYADLIDAGGFAEARTRGTLKLEGKDYIVHDGEIVHFRHSA
ncbi:MAG: redox-regulated ATPase YchF [Acidobacteria bacterium]|nr:redox-regulated ATPase YchF [Acidobacteriota bacterium]